VPIVIAPDASFRRRVLVLLLGLGIVSFGVALTIQAELGVAPYDVLSTGIRDTFGIPIGVAAVILPAIFMGLGMALGGRIGPGSVLAVVLVGPMLGGFLALLPELEAIVPRLACFVAGFVIITIGITLVVVPEIGPGPAELLMLAVHHRGYPLAPARTAIEVASVAVGWAMGGQVGAGTIVFAVLIGPALRWSLTTAGYDARRAAEASDAASPGA
jgi:uncharacterized membrane protein YczE